MSSDTKNAVYVVTGGNRGIGLGLVSTLLARPFTTVVATVRNDEAAAALRSEVVHAATGEKSTLAIVKLDFSATIPPDQIRQAFAVNNADVVDHVDVLICNAGWPAPLNLATETTAEQLRASFEINTIAPLMVFQALWPLLQKSASPKVIMVSSSVGIITEQEAPGGAYGPSKAALNWLTRALHQQNEASGLVAIALHPGWVQTRAGESAAKDWGYPGSPPEKVEGCVKGMLQVIDGATRDATGGSFVTYKGQTLPW
jgi:NAD(P)-dependent dehydrogenase (short-subunit alcohol dehydrogenase family)